MDEQAKPCLSLHVNRTGHASAYGIARDIRINAFLLFRETVHDRWTNPTQNRQLCGNYLRNVATLLLIPDTAPLSASRKVSNFVSADATRVVSHGVGSDPVMRPSAPAGIGAPAHPEAAPIYELHESTPHSFGLVCIVESRSVHMDAATTESPFQHSLGKRRAGRYSFGPLPCDAGAQSRNRRQVTQRGFACVQFRAAEQRRHRLGLGFQPKGCHCERV
jgi:hypothetical protein